MTMDDVKAMTDDWLTPATVASVLHIDRGRLIQYARDGQLPFEVVISGSRVKINRRSFLQRYGYLEEEKKKPDNMELIAQELHAMVLLLTAVLMKTDPDFVAYIERKEPSQ